MPSALAPVIAGFRSLNNFFPKSLVHPVGPVQRDGKTGKWHALNNPNAGKEVNGKHGVSGLAHHQRQWHNHLGGGAAGLLHHL